MIFIFLASVLVAGVAAAWLMQRWLPHGFVQYRDAFTRTAQNRLGEFFLFLDPASLWQANLLACAAVFIVIAVVSASPGLALAAAAVVLAAPRWALIYLRKRRQTRFDEQLPDLLLALSGALRAGSGVQAALRHIVPQAPVPLSQEFGLVLREQRMGVAFEQALSNLYARMPSEGAGLVVSSLKIALHNGGNLAETLERIAATLRSRIQLHARVGALTSQGRLQAWIMACLPLALALVLDRLDPQTMALLWHTPAGWAVLAVVGVLELVGVLLIRRIVDIQV
ncbi:type II secretion system F family protein [Pusillimonas sp.]|uniref:type II secretion system F family protein n=1 Tax=Pusillimonas sp. TaxID=3040095 RepID=UPI0029A3D75D|nr:type II secretion system F family protein [Pusillimonas sp.]MDX3895761.1 type II secretion system F family protein [Pusillimonas sp.]